MSQPIYLLVMGQGFTEAWYQLSKEEQNNLWSSVQEVDKKLNWWRYFSAKTILGTKMDE